MTHPAEIDKDLEKMISKGIPVYVVQEDAKEQDLADVELLSGITKVSRAATCLRFWISTIMCGTGDLTLIAPSRLS